MTPRQRIVLMGSKTLAQKIRALVASGPNGYIYDVSDLSTMRQDSAGTTAAAVGSPVGLLMDKSGFGNHLIQPTAGLRYVLRQSGSVYWLEGGSGRFLYSAASINMTGTSKLSHFFAERVNTSASVAYTSRMGTTGAGYFDIRHKNSLAGDVLWTVTAGAQGSLFINGRTAPFTYINGMIVHVTQPTAISTTGGPRGIRPRYNGVPAIQARELGAWSAGTAMGNYVLSFGASNDGSFSADCNFYGAVGVGAALTETQAELIEGYLDAKAGNVMASAKPIYCAVIGDSTTAEYVSQNTVPSLIYYADGAPAVGGLMLSLPGRSAAQAQAVWEAVTDYSRIRLITIDIGLNDTDYTEAASVAIARIQALVNSVNARKPAGCLVYINSMTSNYAAAVAQLGAVNAAIENQKRLDMNTAIMGGGPTPITGVDRRLGDHVVTMTDGSGNLAAAYDSGDGVHPNNAGRAVKAADIRAAMVLDGFLT